LLNESQDVTSSYPGSHNTLTSPICRTLCLTVSLACALCAATTAQQPSQAIFNKPLPTNTNETQTAACADWRSFLHKDTAIARPDDWRSALHQDKAARSAVSDRARETAPEAAQIPPDNAKTNDQSIAASTSHDQAEPAKADSPDEQIQISSLEIKGDSDLLDQLGLKAGLESDTVGKSLSMTRILDLATRCQETCVKAGYYLARIRVVPTDYSRHILILSVDKGRIGKMSFYDGANPESKKSDSKPSFDGRYFSEAQLRRQLSRLSEDAIFNYDEFYRNVFAINSHPDIKMDTDLRLRSDMSTGTERRFADMDFYVREDSPFHIAAEVKNTGTESTDKWRASITMQHLNLTKASDILTLNTMTSIDFSSLMSFAASYYRPFRLGNGGAVTIYGGYSDVESEEIVPVIDLIGTGWFACLQVSYNLISNDRNLLSLAVSAVYRSIESKLSMSQCDPSGDIVDTVEQVDSIKIFPMSVALSYSTVKPDRLGGRNFLTSQTSFNIGASIGASDNTDLALQRAQAEADYIIERIQAARIQPLFGRTTKDGGTTREWLLFAKADGQIANAPLVPAEQKAAGGMDTVRGYPERDSLGDDGVTGTIELRTPLVPLPFGHASRASSAEDQNTNSSESTSHLQFLAFVDLGHVTLKEPTTDGGATSVSLAGAGLGLRLALTSHVQLRFDWGFPLKETETSSSSGQGHVGIQAQF